MLIVCMFSEFFSAILKAELFQILLFFLVLGCFYIGETHKCEFLAETAKLLCFSHFRLDGQDADGRSFNEV